jgi:hypothetical protein
MAAELGTIIVTTGAAFSAPDGPSDGNGTMTPSDSLILEPC